MKEKKAKDRARWLWTEKESLDKREREGKRKRGGIQPNILIKRLVDTAFPFSTVECYLTQQAGSDRQSFLSL